MFDENNTIIKMKMEYKYIGRKRVNGFVYLKFQYTTKSDIPPIIIIETIDFLGNNIPAEPI